MALSSGPVERIMTHDTWVVIGAVSFIVFLAGLYTAMGVGMSMSAVDMTRMAGPIGEPMSMRPPMQWSWTYAVLVFLMWWVMMVAMMTPSAAPVLLLFTALKRQGPDQKQASGLSVTFLLGYLIAWMGFSVVAALLQWLTETLNITNGAMMTIGSKPVAGAVLVAAGAYQFSSLKAACLKHCRSPAQFLSENHRKGYTGALKTGMHHGAYCLGCCWALMALLFVGGIMNLYWIVGLAIYVLAEKLIPYPRLFSQATGVVLIAGGLWLILVSH